MSDAAVRASVAPVLRALHDEPTGAWSRQTLAMLIGVVEHVEHRPPDPSAARHAALVAALDALAGNPLVPADGSADSRASAALVAALDAPGPDADAVHEVLRPILVRELDDELAVTGELMESFRGRVRPRA